MTELDTVLQGIFISGFSIIGLVTCAYCFRKIKPIKKSPSSEDLSSIGVEDPAN